MNAIGTKLSELFAHYLKKLLHLTLLVGSNCGVWTTLSRIFSVLGHFSKKAFLHGPHF